VFAGGRFRWVNPRLAALLERTPETLMALESPVELVSEDDRDAAAERAEQWARERTPTMRHRLRAIGLGGETLDLEIHVSRTEWGGEPAAIGIVVEVTERESSEARVTDLAYSDPLTKLPNRARLMESLRTELSGAQRHGRRFAIVYLDIDDFQFVNDSWGRTVGDRLLQSFALRLKRRLRAPDTLARVGGDEFVILMPDIRQPEDMSSVVQKLLGSLARPFQFDGRILQVTASAGVTTYPEDGEEPETLLRNAELARARAKDRGRGNFQLCTPELTAKAVERLELQSGLQRALQNDELFLNYQPIVSLSSGRVVGFEALVRWQHPEAGTLLPAKFLSVAEETGLIVPLGEWVLRTATKQLKAWQRHGVEGLRIAVNFSAKQFRDRKLVHVVETALAEAGLAPEQLEAEITESIAMEGGDIVSANLSVLRGMGVSVAIDDFGTGYSSLTYLKSYPVTSLKIDRSFVIDIEANPADQAIVRAIVEMGHGSRLHVVGEGVETQDQFRRLQDCGCDEIQGYWVGRPMSIEGVDEILARERVLWGRQE
jgi:diguanylate cyclase (GGDEF)-like protein/PAS domain S-box-containing protein